MRWRPITAFAEGVGGVGGGRQLYTTSGEHGGPAGPEYSALVSESGQHGAYG